MSLEYYGAKLRFCLHVKAFVGVEGQKGKKTEEYSRCVICVLLMLHLHLG